MPTPKEIIHNIKLRNNNEFRVFSDPPNPRKLRMLVIISPVTENNSIDNMRIVAGIFTNSIKIITKSETTIEKTAN